MAPKRRFEGSEELAANPEFKRRLDARFKSVCYLLGGRNRRYGVTDEVDSITFRQEGDCFEAQFSYDKPGIWPPGLPIARSIEDVYREPTGEEVAGMVLDYLLDRVEEDPSLPGYEFRIDDIRPGKPYMDTTGPGYDNVEIDISLVPRFFPVEKAEDADSLGQLVKKFFELGPLHLSFGSDAALLNHYTKAIGALTALADPKKDDLYAHGGNTYRGIMNKLFCEGNRDVYAMLREAHEGQFEPRTVEVENVRVS